MRRRKRGTEKTCERGRRRKKEGEGEKEGDRDRETETEGERAREQRGDSKRAAESRQQKTVNTHRRCTHRDVRDDRGEAQRERVDLCRMGFAWIAVKLTNLPGSAVVDGIYLDTGATHARQVSSILLRSRVSISVACGSGCEVLRGCRGDECNPDIAGRCCTGLCTGSLRCCDETPHGRRIGERRAATISDGAPKHILPAGLGFWQGHGTRPAAAGGSSRRAAGDGTARRSLTEIVVPEPAAAPSSKALFARSKRVHKSQNFKPPA